MSTLGIDIGGTKILFVLLKKRKIVKFWRISTPETKKALVDALKNNIPQGIQKIGIGVPGPLNKKRDLILDSPNLRVLRNCPLAQIIQRKTGLKTKIDNDANCFALGEALFGAGRGSRTVFGITLGTGVGGGIVIDGKIYHGDFGSAGEIGHTTIKFDGPKCTCGAVGCFEEYCSERFFLRKGATPKEFQNKAEVSDGDSIMVYNEYGKYLGIGLANVVNFLDPGTVVIGGGIANAYRLFIGAAKKEMAKRVISPISKKYVIIKKASLGDFAGAVGAALLHNN